MPTREHTALPTDPARLEHTANPAPTRPPTMMLNQRVYDVAAETSHRGLAIAGLPEVPGGGWHRFISPAAVTLMAPALAAQGDDLARGLLLFAEGRPVDAGPEAASAGWIAAHLASCFRQDQVDEGEAIDWTEDRNDLWPRIAADPLAHAEWMQAPRPWSALAAIFEWDAFVRHGDGGGFVSQLPVTLRNCRFANDGEDAHRLAPLTVPALYAIAAAAPGRDIALAAFGPDLFATRAADVWRLTLTAAEVLRPLAGYGAELPRSNRFTRHYPPALPAVM